MFVDTAAWIALLDADDALHTAVERVWTQLLQQRTLLLTSDFVLLELADVFSTPGDRLLYELFL